MLKSDNQYVERLAAGRGQCPKCGADLVASGLYSEFEIDGISAYQDVECLICDFVWADSYRLTGYVSRVEGEKHETAVDREAEFRRAIENLRRVHDARLVRFCRGKDDISESFEDAALNEAIANVISLL